MNIGIAKIGQKIYFDRSNEAVDRSNTNGNQGTYKLIMLLVENNIQHNFYMISDNDLSSTTDKPINLHSNYFGVKFDFIFILTGLGEYEKDESFISRLNTEYAKGVMFVFLCEDPRCLESMNDDERMNFVPRVIIGQRNEKVTYKGKQRTMIYKPIEKAICYDYNEEIDWNSKTTEVVAIANTSGDKYNRPEILHNLIGTEDIPVYGRLSEEEQKWFVNYCGEVKYDDMMSILDKSISTIIIPIREGWVTSKYVEALMHGVYPIFYKDYATELLKWDAYPVTVDDMDELGETLRLIRDNPLDAKDMVKRWRCTEIVPYTSGELLSRDIMEVIDL